MTAARRCGAQALIVSAASLAGNASSYVFTIVAARALAPAAFGELSALMAVLVVGVVPAMSVQTGVALRVAAAGRGGGRREQGGALGRRPGARRRHGCARAARGAGADARCCTCAAPARR